MQFYKPFELHLHVQVDWHQYGMDWEGPVPVDDNSCHSGESRNVVRCTEQELREYLLLIGGNPFR